jgi:uncharacterized membrane protein YedE/YeeE
LVGGLIGLLAVTTLSFAKKKVGASSAYASLAGVIGRVVAPNHLRTLRYFRDNPPRIGWSLIFVIGAGIGAWIAAWSGGELTGTYLQPMWLRRFGADSYGLRTLVAFMGGVAMAYGARMAGGCTSGHGISGTLQLALSSWIAVLCFFVGGIVTAGLLYRL